MSCAWGLTSRRAWNEPTQMRGGYHVPFYRQCNVIYATAFAVGVEPPTLSGGSGGRLDHLTNGAFPGCSGLHITCDLERTAMHTMSSKSLCMQWSICAVRIFSLDVLPEH